MTAPDRIHAWTWPGKFDEGLWHSNPFQRGGMAEFIRRDPAALAGDETVLAMIGAVVEEAASVAFNACLVPPDGGNPTEDERIVCDAASRYIRALRPYAPTPRQPCPARCNGHGTMRWRMQRRLSHKAGASSRTRARRLTPILRQRSVT